MSFAINTNINAMDALRNLNMTGAALSQSITRLSTGLRINTAADDPAGLIISQKFQAQISGITQAISNTQDGINYAKTADGALGTISTLLQSARSLAVAASNTGVITSLQAQADQTQLQSIVSSISRIASNTQFGTKFLLNGSSGVSSAVTNAADVQALNIGGTFNGAALATNSAVTLTVTTAATQAVVTLSKTFATAGTTDTAGSFTVNGVTFNTTTADTAGSIVSKLNQATSQTGVTASWSAGQGIVLTSQNYGLNATINVADANGVVQAAAGSTSGAGTDAVATLGIAGQTVTFTGGQGGNDGLTLTDKDGNTIRLTQGGNSTSVTGATVGQVTVGSAQFQIGANAGQTTQLSIGNFSASQLGTTAVAGLNMSNLDLTSFAGAQNALSVIDSAIDQVSSARGQIGSFQSNVLQTNVNFLGIAQENLSASNSQILNTDVAAEMTKFTQEQILQSAGISVLSQANSAPQAVLKLLGG